MFAENSTRTLAKSFAKRASPFWTPSLIHRRWRLKTRIGPPFSPKCLSHVRTRQTSFLDLVPRITNSCGESCQFECRLNQGVHVSSRGGTRPSEEAVGTRGSCIRSVRLGHQHSPITALVGVCGRVFGRTSDIVTDIGSPQASRFIRGVGVSPEAPAFRSLTDLFTAVFEKERHLCGRTNTTSVNVGIQACEHRLFASHRSFASNS